MATYQGPFHFVNKDGSNLTRRDPDEAFRISSHVTNKYYQWAKKARSKPDVDGRHRQSGPHGVQKGRNARRDSPSSTPPPSIERRGTPSNTDINSRTICWQLGSGSANTARKSTSPRDSPEPPSQPPAVEEIGEEFLDRELWPNRLPILQTPTLPKQFDFNAPDWAACPIFQKEALAIFRGFFLSYAYTSIQRACSRQMIEKAWNKRATELVSDKKSLHAWYGSVLTLKALYLQPESYSILYPMALKHQNRSMMLLREHIREELGPSKSLILCIWSLSTMAFYRGDIEANTPHQGPMWQAVDELGGIDALDADTRAHVILADNGHARFAMTRPYLDRSRFDPGAFEDQPDFAEYEPLLSDMRFQFQRWDEAFLLPDDPLSDDLHNYVMAHREFMAAHSLAGRLLSEKDQDSARAIFYWLHRRRAAMSSWTMSLYCDIVETITPHTRLSRCVRRQLQACLCLAVSYAMSFVYGFTLPLEKWLLYIPIQNLRPQVEILLEHMSKRGTLPSTSAATPTPSSTPTLSITHHESLLFLFFVGACAEQISDDAGKRPALLLDKRWHSTRFCEMTKILGLRTWKEAKKVLQRFIYGDGVVLDRFVEGLFELRSELVGGGSVF